MLSVAFAAIIAGASASRDHHNQMQSFEHIIPKEFQEHEIHFAPETAFGRVSRTLGSWMGFEKGVGFLTVTAFSDDMCMHAVWETGVNVGRCMNATDKYGMPQGSYRNSVVERKGRFELHTKTFGDSFCWNSLPPAASGQPPAVHSHVDVVDTRCHKFKVAIDGASGVGSYQYSWTAHDSHPKIADFKQELFRGRIEYDNWDTCWGDQIDSMWNMTRYTIQKAPAEKSCYRDPYSPGRSYQTTCGNDKTTVNNEGPSYPTNVYYSDDHCEHREEYMDQHMSYCTQTNGYLPTEMYGGARIYNSPAFGRKMHGMASKFICFVGGNGGSANQLEDKLTPWRRYKDIESGSERHDDHQNQHDDHNTHDDNGYIGPPDSPSNGVYGPPGCYGAGCGCRGNSTQCFSTGLSECSGTNCFCIGSDCACDPSLHMCNTTNAPVVHHCMGEGCSGIGMDAVFMGNVTLDYSMPDHGQMSCNAPGSCKCMGRGCMCLDYSCWCVGNDCNCPPNQNCLSDAIKHYPADYACTGMGCKCTGYGCMTLGNTHCPGPEMMNGEPAKCWCDGPGCELLQNGMP